MTVQNLVPAHSSLRESQTPLDTQGAVLAEELQAQHDPGSLPVSDALAEELLANGAPSPQSTSERIGQVWSTAKEWLGRAREITSVVALKVGTAIVEAAAFAEKHDELLGGLASATKSKRLAPLRSKENRAGIVEAARFVGIGAVAVGHALTPQAAR